MMVDFRKRFGETGLARISEAIALSQSGMKPSEKAASEKTRVVDRSSDDDSSDGTPACDTLTGDDSSTSGTPAAEPNVDAARESTSSTNAANTNHGKLIIDATCAPADFRYPTDVSLLNEAREKTDEIIDVLHGPLVGKSHRPRTYRKTAARAFIRQKKPSRNVIRKAVRKQLGYLSRNLAHIEKLLQNPMDASLTALSRRSHKLLLVCHEVYRQQQRMYDAKARRMDDRIVSLSQPHARPIKRGEAGHDTECWCEVIGECRRWLFVSGSFALGQFQRVA
ncbi:MAG: hypothetical protein H6822_04955 [Planctomycetaceae bacterium]|nr:hypothetical protein [Planctomycetales bacterium]MCB9921505.1 hypothetical protein [Planctomycetaceae bacterium]